MKATSNYSEQSAMEFKSAPVLLLVVLLLSAGVHPAGRQRAFHSEANGYSIAVPEGWTIVADRGTQDSTKVALTEGKRKAYSFEAVIAEHSSTEVGFEYPYLLINVQRYSEVTSKRQLTKNEIAYFLKTVTGLDVDDVVQGTKEAVSDEVRSEVSDTDMRRVYLDEGRPVYRHRFRGESGRTGVGRFQAEVLCHVGKYAAVQLMFYSLESDWSRLDKERNLMFGSFAFDEGMRYEDAASTDSRRIIALVGLAGRVLLYALFAVIVWLKIVKPKLVSKRVHSTKTESEDQEE